MFTREYIDEHLDYGSMLRFMPIENEEDAFEQAKDYFAFNPGLAQLGTVEELAAVLLANYTAEAWRARGVQVEEY